MFDRIFENTSISVLAEVMSFAGLRQKFIANNIANVDTPGFKALDLPEAEFRKMLREAVESKRALGGPLRLGGSGNVRADGFGLELLPIRSGGHVRVDGNDVSMDLELAKISKNAMEFQLAARILASRFRFLSQAVRERVR